MLVQALSTQQICATANTISAVSEMGLKCIRHSTAVQLRDDDACVHRPLLSASHLGNNYVLTEIADASPSAIREELYSPEVDRVTCRGWCARCGDRDQPDIALRGRAGLITLASCNRGRHGSSKSD